MCRHAAVLLPSVLRLDSDGENANANATFTVGVLAPSNPDADPKQGSGTSIQVTVAQVNGRWVGWIKTPGNAFPLPSNATSIEVCMQPVPR